VLKKRQAVEEGEMKVRRGGVEEELASVQPLIDQARKAVGQIKKENIDEIRSLKMPPEAIRDVLEVGPNNSASCHHRCPLAVCEELGLGVVCHVLCIRLWLRCHGPDPLPQDAARCDPERARGGARTWCRAPGKTAVKLLVLRLKMPPEVIRDML
jgi:hypothetical protein